MSPPMKTGCSGEWMSQYRVWEANREVFLFPENWIDPTLRPNASPFYTELRQQLKQGELNAEAAEAGLEVTSKSSRRSRGSTCAGTSTTTKKTRKSCA